MKIRIKSNSIRFRLTKSEVSILATTGFLEEETIFPNNKFIYAIQGVDQANGLTASFDHNKITLFIPRSFITEWPNNNEVGIENNILLPENNTLYLLIEKDFACLDESNEDQSDNYENPNKTG